MKWTILGASGTIGRKLKSHLVSRGEEVFAPARDYLDLCKKPLGHVIYSIGLTADFRQRPYDTIDAHVVKLSELLQHAKFDSLLYLSSTRVYARACGGSESDPLPMISQDPSDLYNLSKLMGESLCQQDCRKNIRVVRLSNVVGGEDADSSNFLPTLVREARGGRLLMRTSLDSVKDYIHIDDVVDILLRIAAGGRERLYNVASGIQTTHEQWATQLAIRTGCKVEVEPGAPTVRFIPVDIGRIRAEFDFQPRPVLSALFGDDA